MDDWGIGVVLTASQKGLGTPPGLSILVASQRAIKVYANRKTPVIILRQLEKVASDHARLREERKSFQGPVPLEDRFKAHKEASRRVKNAAAALGLRCVPLSEEVSANGMIAVGFVVAWP
ncbi:hypothetical protein EDD15DRAFT_2370779 [Pisolithus albus]|nr:hypothetical protein EDD15DRAFT_2370779 [Pisolithus albus]